MHCHSQLVSSNDPEGLPKQPAENGHSISVQRTKDSKLALLENHVAICSEEVGHNKLLYDFGTAVKQELIKGNQSLDALRSPVMVAAVAKIQQYEEFHGMPPPISCSCGHLVFALVYVTHTHLLSPAEFAIKYYKMGYSTLAPHIRMFILKSQWIAAMEWFWGYPVFGVLSVLSRFSRIDFYRTNYLYMLTGVFQRDSQGDFVVINYFSEKINYCTL